MQWGVTEARVLQEPALARLRWAQPVEGAVLGGVTVTVARYMS